MRTKSILLAAAIAASAIPAVAQNVYSLNVVGYVNVTVPAGYSLLANPLSSGSTNGANEVMTVADGSSFMTWNGVGYNFTIFSADFGGWADADGNPANVPVLPPGKGFFFYNPGKAYTNTFVGTVVPAPGTTNSLTLPAGYSLLGSVLPVGGTDITAAPVSLPLLEGESIMTWNGVGYNFRLYSQDFGGWADADGNPATAPSYTPGQGFFFYNPTTAKTWSQTLSLQ